MHTHSRKSDACLDMKMCADVHRCRIKINEKCYKGIIEYSSAVSPMINFPPCVYSQKSLSAISETPKRCHLQHLWCFADMRHLLTPACRESPWIKGFSLKPPIASELQAGLSWRLTARMGGGTGF